MDVVLIIVLIVQPLRLFEYRLPDEQGQMLNNVRRDDPDIVGLFHNIALEDMIESLN